MKNSLITSQNLKHKIVTKFPPIHYVRGQQIKKHIEETFSAADEIIFEVIMRGNPSFIGRFGGSEAKVLGCYFDIYRGQSLLDPVSTLTSILLYKKRLRQLSSLSGVYPPTLTTGKIFSLEYVKALEQADVLACWGEAFTSIEHQAHKISNAKIVHHHATSPWVEPYVKSDSKKKSWASALDGKRVAIVSGFSETFASQHEIINKVFEGVNYPRFDPVYIKAPLTQGGIDDGRDWKWHLEKTKEAIRKSNFDVLLVSAGGYSFPLAAHAKEIGKIGINCGGELQLFFGVIGKRWDESSKVNKFRNEFWVRPSEAERPANWREIENGCYW
jgi:hypothetical protein